jgi:hypothetical protein
MATTTKTPQAPAPIDADQAPVHPFQNLLDTGDIDGINNNGARIEAWIRKSDKNKAKAATIIAEHQGNFYHVLWDHIESLPKDEQ